MSTGGTLVFVLFACVALGAAVATIAAKNAIRAAVGLLAHIISLAALYLTLHAHLLATLQLIVYAGAVVVLFIFVIMLIGPTGDDEKSNVRGILTRVFGASLMAIITMAIAFNVTDVTPTAPNIAGCTQAQGAECNQFGGVRALGTELYTSASLPFELVSILLLVAVIGAIAVGRGRTHEEVLALKAKKAQRLAGATGGDAPASTPDAAAPEPVGGE